MAENTDRDLLGVPTGVDDRIDLLPQTPYMPPIPVTSSQFDLAENADFEASPDAQRNENTQRLYEPAQSEAGEFEPRSEEDIQSDIGTVIATRGLASSAED